jgi:hypothetical protein
MTNSPQNNTDNTQKTHKPGPAKDADKGGNKGTGEGAGKQS